MNAGRGYIALTDPEWHRYLAAQPRVDEVNFWRPHGAQRFTALERGELFFFKLRAPHKSIAGFGFFERFESMPAWLAWNCFGSMNGALNFNAMLDRILRLRGDDSLATRAGDFRIGCIMISAPVFFSEQDWVEPPSDWAQTGIQTGKRYSLDSGEGRRILGECLARAQSGGRHWNVEPAEPEMRDAARYGSPILVRPRLGQGLFSLEVRDAYRGACTVTGEHSIPVLEAAHIKPYASGGEHRVSNGLLLRRDLHRLFDLGYVTVTPDREFRVGARLRDEFHNGRSYYDYDRKRISEPTHDLLRPSRELLDWHNQVVFKG
ncbi:MAG: HNH endonuclease [Woeseiaceae bacterium]